MRSSSSVAVASDSFAIPRSGTTAFFERGVSEEFPAVTEARPWIARETTVMPLDTDGVPADCPAPAVGRGIKRVAREETDADTSPKKARTEIDARFAAALKEQSEAGAIDLARRTSMPSAASDTKEPDAKEADKTLDDLKKQTFDDVDCALIMYCAAERDLAISNLPPGYILMPKSIKSMEEMKWFLGGCKYDGNEAIVGSLKRRRAIIDTRDFVQSYYVPGADCIRVQKYGGYKVQAVYLMDGEMFAR